ncbi:MAG: hypothetical protein HUU46_04915 [Candidatus Hydrogenedentes bacterium]|nr:hypothetical protein [Candidatus Hydrogenedentota bacterium]
MLVLRTFGVVVVLCTYASLDATAQPASVRGKLIISRADAAWQSQQIEEPCILPNPKDPAKLIMFYGAVPASDRAYAAVGKAWARTSDPFTWYQYEANPIFRPGETGWDSASIRLDTVLYIPEEDSYYIYYSGTTGTVQDRIGLAICPAGEDGYSSISPEAIKRYGDKPILAPEPAAPYYEDMAQQAAVMREWNEKEQRWDWYMYYSYRGKDGILPGIRLATSHDGKNWTRRYNANDPRGMGQIFESTPNAYYEWHQIQKIENTYVLCIEVGIEQGKRWRPVLAVSTDPAEGWTQIDVDTMLQTKWEGLYGDNTLYHVATPALYSIENKWYLFCQACGRPGNDVYTDGAWEMWAVECNLKIPTRGGCAGVFIPGVVSSDAANSARMPLHPTRWSVDGKPILGTYAPGDGMLASLDYIRDAGMNIVFGGENELDPATPEGAYCAKHGIKVLHHLTSHLYHGVSLREPISADQVTIPLSFQGGRPKHTSKVVQIDDEIIRYDSIDDTGLLNCQRGCDGTKAAEHREGTILFWPGPCADEIRRVKDSPNLFGYYTLDDSPGDSVSALRAMYATVQKEDLGKRHPVCAGFGDDGSLINFAPGVCDIMFIYWYPVGTKSYERDRTSQVVQRMLTTARSRVPGIPFVGIYQAFDGRPANTGQGVPTGEQLREQLEDFVREGASGLAAYWLGNEQLPGWATLPELGSVVRAANREAIDTGGLMVRPETESMKATRLQSAGHWATPAPFPGAVPAWYVIGPFEDTEGKLLDAVFPPDSSIDTGAIHPVKDGKAGWRVRETTCGTLGLTNIYGRRALKNAAMYLYCDVTSSADRQLQMRVCTDDDGIVRLNDIEVYRHDGPRGLDYDKDIVPVTLPAGTSRIFVKVYNRAGMSGVSLRFTNLDGTPAEGLTFTP